MNSTNSSNSTKIISDYIKGICIIDICWHHLIYNNFPNDFSYLGHQVVVFFFILSGYGIYKSIDANPVVVSSASQLMTYLLKRAIRIYPLYWLWIVTSYDIDKLTLGDFLLVSLNNPPVWFLNTIIYCYIVSPLFYLISKRTGYYSLIIYTLLLLAINAILDILRIPITLCTAYCKVYFFYLFFFGCGMAIANPVRLHIKQRIYICILFITILIYVFSALQVSMFSLSIFKLQQVRIYYFPVNPYVFLFAITSIFLTFILLNGSPPLFLHKYILYFGKYSLSIYLFHGYYVQYIVSMTGNDQPFIFYFAIFVLFSPVLLAGCATIEYAVKSATDYLMRHMTRTPSVKNVCKQ